MIIYFNNIYNTHIYIYLAVLHMPVLHRGTTLDQVDTLPYMIDEFGVPHEIPVDAVGLSEDHHC
jgi:hypothetical protein